MKRFDYEVALNQLQLGKEKQLNTNIKYDFIPNWVQGNDFLKLFLPYLKIIGDSREQDKWIESACNFYGIAFEWAKKDKKANTENLKEGDYTYKVISTDVTHHSAESAAARSGRRVLELAVEQTVGDVEDGACCILSITYDTAIVTAAA